VGYGIVCDASLYISNPRSVSILETPGASEGPDPHLKVILSWNDCSWQPGTHWNWVTVVDRVARPWAFDNGDTMVWMPPSSAEEPLRTLILNVEP
jgi:hypothetical protein